MKAILFLLIFGSSTCYSQVIRLTDGNSQVMAFYFDGGLATVEHADFLFGVRDTQNDLLIVNVKPPLSRLKLGFGWPHYFCDRRGVRHFMKPKRFGDSFWLVDVEFFSGESGLPVFNRAGHVVGVVSGNELSPDSGGLVSRIGTSSIFAGRVRVPPLIAVASSMGLALSPSFVDAEQELEFRTASVLPFLVPKVSPALPRISLALRRIRFSSPTSRK